MLTCELQRKEVVLSPKEEYWGGMHSTALSPFLKVMRCLF